MFIESIISLFCFDVPEDIDGPTSGGTGNLPPETPKPETVSREAYEKAVTEARNAKKRLKEIDDAKIAQDEKDALARGEHERLLTDEKARNEKLTLTLSERDQKDLNRDKTIEFFRALGTNLDEKYLDLIDISHIKVDADGNVDKASAVKYANDFKTRFKEILPITGATNFPDVKPQGGGNPTAWTADKTTRANLKDRLSAMPDAVERRIQELIRK